MTLTTQQKMMLITLYLMSTSMGSFEEFCKSISGFPEEEIDTAFDTLEAEMMEDMILKVDTLSAEIAKSVHELYVYWEEKKNGQSDISSSDS